MEEISTDLDIVDRATASLLGLAIGDALGMPTQSMSRTRIDCTYGTIDRLLSSVADQPIAPSLPAGTITDDTEQALLLGTLLVAGKGRIDPRTFADALAEWERTMEATGSKDLLGPSTKAAITAIHGGASPDDDPGKLGTTNGAAMRIAPIGIAFGADTILDAVVESSRLTHNTGLGLSGAGAVGAAVSFALDHPDSSILDVADVAAAAADQLHDSGNWVAGAQVGARIRWACRAIADLGEADALDLVANVIGTSVASQESIPAAFALMARFGSDPFLVLRHAAALGGDTDTIAAMAGAVLGALHGAAVWPADIARQVVTVNHLDFGPLVSGLLHLRQRT